MKVILPWLKEIATEPKKVQKLIEQRALQDWYSNHSNVLKFRKKDDKTASFLITEKRRVRDFVSRLPDLERVIVYLRYWENLLNSEIATVVGVSENSIDKILEESVRKLRALYISELSKVQTSLAAIA